MTLIGQILFVQPFLFVSGGAWWAFPASTVPAGHCGHRRRLLPGPSSPVGAESDDGRSGNARLSGVPGGGDFLHDRRPGLGERDRMHVPGRRCPWPRRPRADGLPDGLDRGGLLRLQHQGVRGLGTGCRPDGARDCDDRQAARVRHCRRRGAGGLRPASPVDGARAGSRRRDEARPFNCLRGRAVDGGSDAVARAYAGAGRRHPVLAAVLAAYRRPGRSGRWRGPVPRADRNGPSHRSVASPHHRESHRGERQPRLRSSGRIGALSCTPRRCGQP